MKVVSVGFPASCPAVVGANFKGPAKLGYCDLQVVRVSTILDPSTFEAKLIVKGSCTGNMPLCACLESVDDGFMEDDLIARRKRLFARWSNELSLVANYFDSARAVMSNIKAWNRVCKNENEPKFKLMLYEPQIKAFRLKGLVGKVFDLWSHIATI